MCKKHSLNINLNTILIYSKKKKCQNQSLRNSYISKQNSWTKHCCLTHIHLNSHTHAHPPPPPPTHTQELEQQRLKVAGHWPFPQGHRYLVTSLSPALYNPRRHVPRQNVHGASTCNLRIWVESTSVACANI